MTAYTVLIRDDGSGEEIEIASFELGEGESRPLAGTIENPWVQWVPEGN